MGRAFIGTWDAKFTNLVHNGNQDPKTGKKYRFLEKGKDFFMFQKEARLYHSGN